MAVKLTNLQKIADQYNVNKPFVYTDLHLDFKKSSNYDITLEQNIPGNDIGVDYDEDAIKNSLRNLFNTKPGQRFLFPLYGLDLNQFLFEAITPMNAQLIGDKIASSIDRYEPRVRLTNVDIVPDPERNLYDITIVVSIPIFNSSVTINTNLDTKTQSFVYIDTPRNR